jgi:hypothetical protein
MRFAASHHENAVTVRTADSSRRLSSMFHLSQRSVSVTRDAAA